MSRSDPETISCQIHGGTHAELLTEGGIYRELYELQFLGGGETSTGRE